MLSRYVNKQKITATELRKSKKYQFSMLSSLFSSQKTAAILCSHSYKLRFSYIECGVQFSNENKNLLVWPENQPSVSRIGIFCFGH